MNLPKKWLQFSFRAPFVKRVLLLGATLLASIFGLAIFVPGPIQKDSYMGAEYCGSCHQGEYKHWAESRHARATANLPAEFQQDRSCLTCHATAVLEQGTPVLDGVSCEACHGPGKHYASLHVKKDPVFRRLLFMQDPTIESCKQCHAATGLTSIHAGLEKSDVPGSVKAPFHRQNEPSMIKPISHSE